MPYQIPNNIAKFIEDELVKEIKAAKTMHLPLEYTVNRIFALIEIAASKAIPQERKVKTADIHREL